jgi:single-strand DNA-binding protein
MGFVNKVMLMGNLTREPQLRQLSTGTAVCDFGLATNRVFKTPAGEERQETVFVDCTAFGRTAEVIEEYCQKGRSIFIEGRLHFENWEDAAGNRRSKLTVIVENFQFTGARESGTAGTTGNLYENISAKPPAPAAPAAQPALRAGKSPKPARTVGKPADRRELASAGAGKSSSVRDAEETQDVDLPF